MGSSRLPGKVLMPIAGVPLLAFMIERLRPLDVQMVVATSDLERDDPIANLVVQLDVPCVRGSEVDVLERFLLAADSYPHDTVVRLTADCPLSDPALVQAVVAQHQTSGADYTSNTLLRTYPDGLDVEVMDANALRRAARAATAQPEREHVTPYLYRNPHEFTLAAHVGPCDLEDERWTVDTAEDFDRIAGIALRSGGATDWRDVLAINGTLDRPSRVVLRVARDAASIANATAGRATQCASEDSMPVLKPGHRTYLIRCGQDVRGALAIRVDRGVGELQTAFDLDDELLPDLLRAIDVRLAADLQVHTVVVRRPVPAALATALLQRGFEASAAHYSKHRCR
jgi:spore coat polysaccharide biosynthesis protein SpsF